MQKHTIPQIKLLNVNLEYCLQMVSKMTASRLKLEINESKFCGITLHVCMYVCMHVSMYIYVCIYVHMYVCMYERLKPPEQIVLVV